MINLKKVKWPFSIVSIRNITLGQTFFEENLRIIIHDIKICQKNLHCDSKMNFRQRHGFSGYFFSGSRSLALKLSFKKSSNDNIMNFSLKRLHFLSILILDEIWVLYMSFVMWVGVCHTWYKVNKYFACTSYESNLGLSWRRPTRVS